MIRNYSDVNELLLYWGAWRGAGTSYYHSTAKVAYHTSPPDKAYYWQTCQECHGTGLTRDLCAEYKTQCQKCYGRPRIKVFYDRVDPRMIPATGKTSLMYVVYAEKPPAEYERIDEVLQGMYIGMAAVLLAHYVYYPHYGVDLAPRIRWVNERLQGNQLPVLDGEIAYKGILRAAKGILAQLFGIPVSVHSKVRAISGGKGGKARASNMTPEERKKASVHALKSRVRDTLHLKKRLTTAALRSKVTIESILCKVVTSTN